MSVNAGFVRVTVSLPPPINEEIETIKEALQVSKSEVVKLAVENFFKEYKRQKLQEAALKMLPEYAKGGDLAALNDLDGEAFL